MFVFNGSGPFAFQALVSVAVRVLSALTGLLVSVVIGRYLGAEQAGYYFIGLGFVIFLSAFCRFGLDDTVLRTSGVASSFSDRPDIKSVLVKSCIILALFSSVASVFVFVFSDFISAFFFGKPELGYVFEMFSPGVFFAPFFVIFGMVLQGFGRILSAVFLVNIFVGLFVVFYVFVCDVRLASDAALIYSYATFFNVLIGFALVFRVVRGSVGVVEYSELLKSCLPLWVVVVMQQTVLWSGQLVAGAWVTSSEVAQLAVAQRTSLLVSFFMLAVNMVVAPRFAQLYRKGDMEGLKSLMFLSSRIMFGISVPVVFLLLAFPVFFMGLFGDSFVEGHNLLVVLVLGQFVCVLSGPVNYLLTMSGHERELRSVVLISGPLSIILAFVLTPMLGVYGAALSTAVATASQGILGVWWVRKRLGFNVFASYKF